METAEATANIPHARQRPSTGKRTPRESLEEYGRGLAGGLLFSLPMLYTMEIWSAAHFVDSSLLLIYISVTFLLLLGYNRYAGMREDASFWEVAIDSVEEMGIGLLVAALVLTCIGQVNTEMSISEIVGKIVVESMTVAVGISIGTAQLGGASSGDDGSGMSGDHEKTPNTVGQLVLAFCGAILFAANVGPTEEIQLVATEASSLKLLVLAAFSLLIGAIILLYSGFIGSNIHIRSGGYFWALYGVVSTYAAALLASAVMLWFFQRFEGYSVVLCVSQTVVLAFPAMLGASAGRLLIQ